jgi:hypothetical protein
VKSKHLTQNFVAKVRRKTMAKKMVLAIIAALVVVGAVNAQESGQTWWNSYAPGIDQKVLVNAGIGFGPTGGYENGVIPLSVSADFKLPIALPITVGGIFTYSQWKYSVFSNDLKWNNIGFGLRGMYHFNFLKNLDTYTGITLGYVVQTFDGKDNLGYDGVSFFLFGYEVGARYFFTKNIGAYVEVGYSGLQFASLGLALKF